MTEKASWIHISRLRKARGRVSKRVLHYEEAEGEGNGDVNELAALKGRGCGGDEVGKEDAYYHCEENEDEEETVE